MLDVRFASIDFPALVDELVTHHGFTEEALARRVGTKRGAIHYWRTQRSIPRHDTAWRLICLWERYTGKPYTQAPRA